MGPVFANYSAMTGVPVDQMTWICHEQHVTDADTAISLGLADGGEIGIVIKEPEKAAANGDGTINLHIVFGTDDEITMKVTPTILLSKVFVAFCARKSVPPKSLRFMFDGMRLRDLQTPNSAGLEDGDQIHAMLDLTGGNLRV